MPVQFCAPFIEGNNNSSMSVWMTNIVLGMQSHLILMIYWSATQLIEYLSLTTELGIPLLHAKKSSSRGPKHSRLTIICQLLQELHHLHYASSVPQPCLPAKSQQQINTPQGRRRWNLSAPDLPPCSSLSWLLRLWEPVSAQRLQLSAPTIFPEAEEEIKC